MVRKNVALAGMLVALGASLAAAPASATVVSYGAVSGGIPLTLTDWTQNLLFPEFDPSLGTLQSVSFTLTDAFSTTLTVTNGAISSSTGNTFASVALGVDDPNHLLVGTQLVVTSGTAVQSAIYTSSPPQVYSLVAGGATTLPTKTGGGTFASGTLTSAGFLSEFTGVSNIGLGLSTFTTTSISNNGGNTSTSQVTRVGATGTVNYTYTPLSVPEPMSLALLGSGLFALGLVRRRMN